MEIIIFIKFAPTFKKWWHSSAARPDESVRTGIEQLTTF